jgi:hypothetical protein
MLVVVMPKGSRLYRHLTGVRRFHVPSSTNLDKAELSIIRKVYV